LGSERREDETEIETAKEPQILKRESWFRRKVQIDRFPLVLLFFEDFVLGQLIFNSNAALLNKFLGVITFVCTFILTFSISYFFTDLETDQEV